MSRQDARVATSRAAGGAVCLTGAEADDMLNEACNTLLTKKMDEAE
jgi:hypothetical protein